MIQVLLMTVVTLIDGNLEIAFSSLGWKTILMMSSNTGDRKDIISLSKSGFHVSARANLCSSAKDDNHVAGIDGTASEMRTYNETSLKRVIECGNQSLTRT